MNDLVFKDPEEAKSWPIHHAQKYMYVLVLHGKEIKTCLEWFVREAVIQKKATRGRNMFIKELPKEKQNFVIFIITF